MDEALRVLAGRAGRAVDPGQRENLGRVKRPAAGPSLLDLVPAREAVADDEASAPAASRTAGRSARSPQAIETS